MTLIDDTSLLFYPNEETPPGIPLISRQSLTMAISPSAADYTRIPHAESRPYFDIRHCLHGHVVQRNIYMLRLGIGQEGTAHQELLVNVGSII